KKASPNLSSQAAIWKMLFSRGGAQTDGHEQGKTAQACHASQARCPDRGWYAGQLRLAKQARAANPSRSWRGAGAPRCERSGRHRNYPHLDLHLFQHGRNEGVGRGQEQSLHLHALRESNAERGGKENCGARRRGGRGRSEEHTSELQSRGQLVCRLLLEKK